MKKSNPVKRQEVPYVWVAEVAYKYSRWITLWTTCRLTKDAARIALLEHSTIADYHFTRVVKFKRA